MLKRVCVPVERPHTPDSLAGWVVTSVLWLYTSFGHQSSVQWETVCKQNPHLFVSLDENPL